MAKDQSKAKLDFPVGDSGYEFDEEFSALNTLDPADDTVAVKPLQIINNYLWNDKPLPYNIREYIYQAFYKTIHAKPQKRAIVLARELGIRMKRQRPSEKAIDEIGKMVEEQLKTSANKTQALKLVAKKTQLSLTSVRNKYAKFLEDKIQEESDFQRVKKLEKQYLTKK